MRGLDRLTYLVAAGGKGAAAGMLPSARASIPGVFLDHQYPHLYSPAPGCPPGSRRQARRARTVTRAVTSAVQADAQRVLQPTGTVLAAGCSRAECSRAECSRAECSRAARSLRPATIR